MSKAALKSDLLEEVIARHATPSDASAWAQKSRNGALGVLRQTGLPVGRDEYWRFTDPTAFTASNSKGIAQNQTDVFDQLDRIRLVFVDGQFSEERSDSFDIPGLSIEPLENAMSQDIHWAKDVFGVLEARGQTPVSRPFAALNTACATQGLTIRATEKISTPIELVYVSDNASTDNLIHNTIKLDAGAKLTILETGAPGQCYNTCMEVDIADRAAFHHIRTQGNDLKRISLTHLFARLGEESALKSFTLSANGAMTRNECVVELNGDDASAHVAGAVLGDGDFHHDDTIFLTHDALNCESRQVYKKVLRNGAVGVFQGKILVKAGAQKTDGYQISKGLMLDDNSQFLAKPELEIYADDVACSHGSTVGTLDEEAMFYLASRGVPKKNAEHMLVLAFLDESVQEIEAPEIADIIRARLALWAGSEIG